MLYLCHCTNILISMSQQHNGLVLIFTTPNGRVCLAGNSIWFTPAIPAPVVPIANTILLTATAEYQY